MSKNKETYTMNGSCDNCKESFEVKIPKGVRTSEYDDPCSVCGVRSVRINGRLSQPYEEWLKKVPYRPYIYPYDKYYYTPYPYTLKVTSSGTGILLGDQSYTSAG